LVIFGLQPFIFLTQPFIFLDELLAPGGVVLGVIGFFGVGSREVSRCVRFMRTIDFGAIFALKTTTSPVVGLRKSRGMQKA
jgi:hypothetical protein